MTDELLLGIAGYIVAAFLLGVLIGRLLRQRAVAAPPAPPLVTPRFEPPRFEPPDFAEMSRQLDAVTFDWPRPVRPNLHVLPGGQDDGGAA